MNRRLSEHLRRGGWRGAWRAVLAKFLHRPLPVDVRVPRTNHRLRVRLRSSDLWTFDEIFERREYDVPLPQNPKVIVDAGANVGLAAVYFAIRFPSTRVIALEPEEENFALLQSNAAPFPNIEPIRAALWHESTDVTLTDPGQGAWAFRVGGVENVDAVVVGKVPAMTIPELMTSHRLSRVDVLKLDVEGAEREIFGHADEWIGRVDSVIVELHEGIAPGCGEAFLKATEGFPFRWQKGENTVAGRENYPWPVQL